MPTTSWNSQSGVGDFLDPAQWTNGAPAPGDLVVVTYGQPSLSGATLDNMTIDVIAQSTSTATLQLSNVTLGPGLLFEDLGTSDGAAIDASGTLINNGTLLFNASVGGLFNGFSFDMADSTSQLVNDGQITITHSDGLFLTGGTVTNAGTITDQSQRLFIDSTLVGTGLIELAGSGGSGAGAEFGAPVGTGQTIDFGDALSTLTIEPQGPDGAAAFQGTLTDFRAGDAIDVANSNFVGGSFNLATRTLSLSTSQGTATILLGGTVDYTKTFTEKSDGNGGFLISTSVTVSAGGPGTDTVTGSDGSVRSVVLSTTQEAAVAAPLLAALTPATTTFIDAAGSATMTAGYTGLVDDAAGAVTTLGNGAANETVVASAGNFAFTSGGGSGTIVTGGGNDFVFLPSGGNWAITLGAGANTVVAVAGNDTVTTGSSGALVFLGKGATSIASFGADTVVGQTGAVAVTASKSSALVFALGSALNFTGGSGADTVIGGQAGANLTGGAGNMLAFTDGTTQYQGGSGADTLVGLAGSLNVQAGTGSALVFGGFAGNNRITSGNSGMLTAYGEGGGDVITALGSATVLAAAGSGAETLSGASSSGTLAFFGGSGVDLLQAGTAAGVLVAGFGGGTLAGGTGSTLFEFVHGRTFGAETITGWGSQDFIQLSGYSNNTSSILSAATVLNGSTSFALSDGTQITVAGVTDPSTLNFATPTPTSKV